MSYGSPTYSKELLGHAAKVLLRAAKHRPTHPSTIHYMKLTNSELTYLWQLVSDNIEAGTYYGNKAAYDKRARKLEEQFAFAIKAAQALAIKTQ